MGNHSLREEAGSYIRNHTFQVENINDWQRVLPEVPNPIDFLLRFYE